MHSRLVAGDGLSLFVRHWQAHGPARGTVLIVHGLGEHIGRYEHVAAALVGAGWRVAGFDQRGHGRSDGARGRLRAADDLLADLALVIDAVRAQQPGPLVLLGHSLGGLVAARVVAGSMSEPVPGSAEHATSGTAARATSPPPPWARQVDALVLSSPALRMAMSSLQKAMLAALERFVPNAGVANGLEPAWLSRDPAVVAGYVADPLVHDRIAPRLVRFMLDAIAAVHAAAPYWSVPTLLLYAGADRCVVPAGSAAFAAAAPAGVVKARAFPALFHEIFNEPERPEVLSALLAWLDTLNLSPARSPP